MTELYFLTLAEAEKLDPEYCRRYFPERTARAEKFRQPGDRYACLGAGALLKTVLDVNEEDLLLGEFGKPGLRGGKKHFNISHSGEYIMLGVSDHPLGVDIERKDPGHLSVAGRVVTSREKIWMEEDPENRFFSLWTMKEAVLKSMGCGMNVAMKGIDVLPLLSGRPIQIEGKNFYGEILDVPGYAVSVCASGGSPDIKNMKKISI